MRGTVLYAPRDVRFEERPDPTIIAPTDAILQIAATCVCGSDLWPYRGIAPITQPQPMGHEYCGIVAEVGSAVRTITPGQFVVGSFWASDNTCPICRAGYQCRCVDARPMGPEGAQAPLLRVPLADGTLVATPDIPSDDLIPSLLAASDVLGTGWFGAVAAGAHRGRVGAEPACAQDVGGRQQARDQVVGRDVRGGDQRAVRQRDAEQGRLRALRPHRPGVHAPALVPRLTDRAGVV